MLKLKFVNENDEKNPDYICSICKEFLYPDETMQLSCCHMYCSECIETLNSSSLYSSVECPLCMKKSNPQNIKTTNRFAYNILSSVESTFGRFIFVLNLLAGLVLFPESFVYKTKLSVVEITSKSSGLILIIL